VKRPKLQRGKLTAGGEFYFFDGTVTPAELKKTSIKSAKEKPTRKPKAKREEK
jgi:hypothetical protein